MKIKHYKEFVNKKASGNNNSDDDMDDSFSSVPLARISQQNNTYVKFITGDIQEDIAAYADLLIALDNASPDEVFILYVDSHGGAASGGLALYHAILSTEAYVVVRITGYAASAATFLLLAADKVELGPLASIMCHSASYGSGGTQKNIRTRVDFMDKNTSRIMHEIYEGFLTEEEIEDMIENQVEHWMDTEDVMNRLQARQEYFQNKIEQEQQELEKANAKSRRKTK